MAVLGINHSQEIEEKKEWLAVKNTAHIPVVTKLVEVENF